MEFSELLKTFGSASNPTVPLQNPAPIQPPKPKPRPPPPKYEKKTSQSQQAYHEKDSDEKVFNPFVQQLIEKLSTPEGIQKWREERKKNFPTKEKVETEKQELQSRIHRGEFIPTDKDLKKMKRYNGINERNPFSKRQKSNYNDRSHQRPREHRDRPQKPAQSTPVTTTTQAESKMEEESTTSITIPPESASLEIKEEKQQETESPEKSSPEKLEEADEEPEESSSKVEIPLPDFLSDESAKPSTTAPTSDNQRRPRLCKYFQRGNCKNGDQCRFSHTIFPKSDKPKPRRTPKLPPAAPKRTSLIDKLCQEDVLAEKNKILQCFRYIVNQNFFC